MPRRHRRAGRHAGADAGGNADRVEGGRHSQGAPKTSVPSVPRPAAAPSPDPAPTLSRPPDASDREALNRCNAEWQAYKARHNLTGAKAWHVFMARCLP